MAVRSYGQQSRDLILQAAQTLFARRGLHQTSMNEIAAAAGLSRATVFNHFGSKALVLDALTGRSLRAYGTLLGDGRRVGARLDFLAPLDGLGLPRGELRLRGLIQDTRVTDPLTSLERRFSDEAEWSYSVDIRQPAPRLKLAWGLLWERADEVQLFRLRELRTTGWERANLDLYVETTAITGVVVRFTVADVLLPQEIRERRFFAPNRAAQAGLTQVETRRATGGYGTRSYTLRVAGRF